MPRAKNMTEFRRMARDLEAEAKKQGDNFQTLQYGEVKRETDKALLFEPDLEISPNAPSSVWLPKSQITTYINDLTGEQDGVYVPVWLAKAKGLC